MCPIHTPDYVEAMTSPNSPRGRLSQNPQLSASERDRLVMYEEALMDLDVRGFKQASVIRFSPWDQTVDGVAHTLKKLPGVPTDAERWQAHSLRIELHSGLSIPFTHHVISGPYISVGTRFRGRSEEDSTAETKASVDLPLVLARDIVGQQNQFQSQGGIVCYESHELPGKLTSSGIAGWINQQERMPLLDAIEAAFARMILHMNSLNSQAEQAHITNDKNLMREVRGNRFRQAVQYMMNAGLMTNPPSWFTDRAEGSKVKSVECPLCGVRCNANASVCPSNHVIDPFKAYGTAYDESTPGGIMTARRMTQLQLKELGLYPRIKPHAEWLADQNEDEATRPDRDKPSKGKGKQD